MKVCLLLILFSVIHSARSQTVRVQGVLIDGNNREQVGVSIVRNDTLLKYQKHMPVFPRLPKTTEVNHLSDKLKRYSEGWKDLIADTNYVTQSKKEGKFSIDASLSDTLTFKSLGWESQKHAVKDLVALDKIEIRLEREKCIEYVRTEKPVGKTYIFVGEKISVDRAVRERYCNTIPFDSKFTAKYKILRNLEGEFTNDTISFTVYDHYGEPAFSHFQYALLFVTEYAGELIHQKYQYFDVYPTADGRWASPGDPYRFDHKKGELTANPIAFRKDIAFDVKGVVPHVITRYYPAPWYKLESGITRPVSGVYVEDLVKIKKEGVLKARGLN